MSVSALIDFFDKEIEATNELKLQLQNLQASIIEIQLNDIPVIKNLIDLHP